MSINTFLNTGKELSASLKSCLQTKSEIHPLFINNQRRLQDIFFFSFPVYLYYINIYSTI